MRRKKELAFGSKAKEQLRPPYLTETEKREMLLQFELFGETIDLKQGKLEHLRKLQISTNLKKDKCCHDFLQSLLVSSDKITFDLYLQAIEDWLSNTRSSEKLETIFNLIVDKEGEEELSMNEFLKILQDVGEDKLTEDQACQILSTITGAVFTGRVNKQVIMCILAQRLLET